ncbi:hypothetical protein [Fimbriimonas ginsengisoli]|uniref:Uncharacterized protein n=1 Tax=Fimbriimonas ginsengisoli Gsoil 348 TaxID=661478 RepID=A0A068NY07_FIMGI|nr:hypothetical protein [Fimbriimonas ginsengisoli]AIE87735.1 hypothetical protein OP10G_4367 [Fimbriimonas ginsengisoli Gsoil 348]
MTPDSADQMIAGLLNTMNRGQYMLLVTAIERLGGNLRVDASDLAAWETVDLPIMRVDASDGPVILSLS